MINFSKQVYYPELYLDFEREHTYLVPGKQDFCIASTVYRRNSWASSWLP